MDGRTHAYKHIYRSTHFSRNSVTRNPGEKEIESRQKHGGRNGQDKNK